MQNLGVLKSLTDCRNPTRGNPCQKGYLAFLETSYYLSTNYASLRMPSFKFERTYHLFTPKVHLLPGSWQTGWNLIATSCF